MVRTLIDIVAEKHNDWIYMAKSFGCCDDDANELVQEMYLRLNRYVDDLERIMYNDTEINTFYVYVTLRNLYLSNFHKIRSKNHVELKDNIFVEDEPTSFEYEKTFDSLINKIESLVGDWYWYDKKIWDIHFSKEMSMRKISKETTISLSSIFNTLKNGKTKVREGTIKEYQKYLKAKKK